MALIQCVECGEKVSDFAPACPKCGYSTRSLGKRDRRLPSGQEPGSRLAIVYSVLASAGPIAFILGLALLSFSNSVVEVVGVLFCVAGGASVLAAPVVFCVWLYRAWRVASREPDDPTPGMAVGLMFVPFFNLYWIFKVIPGLSSALQRELQARNPSHNHGAGYGVGIAACVVSLVPYVNLISFILFIVWVNLANRAMNQLILLETPNRK